MSGKVWKGCTNDTLFDGKLSCWQAAEGYRFSIDSVLLAHFCLRWNKAKILDLGTGCGVLGLILLYKNSRHIEKIVGVEFQEKLVSVAKKNVEVNGYQRKFDIVHGDYRQMKKICANESFTHVICNPPFYKKGSGRVSVNEEALRARHQEDFSLDTLVSAIAFSLKNKGDAALIYPAYAISELLLTLLQKRLQPKRIRFVYSYPESAEAKLVLVMCKKNGGEGTKIEAPLYIYTRKNGDYSEEVKCMYVS